MSKKSIKKKNFNYLLNQNNKFKYLHSLTFMKSL